MSCTVACEDLATHDAHAVAFAGAAGKAADALVVVVDGSDGSGAVRTVAGVAVRGIVELGNHVHEVEAGDVVDIAVAVVIDARLSVPFLFVVPDIALQVGVGGLDGLVDDGHDDRVVTAGQLLPDGLHVDVRPFVAGGADVHVAAVDVVPLVLEHRVVEDGVRLRGGREVAVEGVGDVVRGFSEEDIVFHQFQLRDFGIAGASTFSRLALRQLDQVPAVHTVLAFEFLLAGNAVEDAFHGNGTFIIKGLQRRFIGGRLEQDQEGAVIDVDRLMNDLGCGIGEIRREFSEVGLFRAGRQQQRGSRQHHSDNVFFLKHKHKDTFFR